MITVRRPFLHKIFPDNPTGWYGIPEFLYPGNTKKRLRLSAFSDSAVHARSGGVRFAQHHRIGSSRNL